MDTIASNIMIWHPNFDNDFFKTIQQFTSNTDIHIKTPGDNRSFIFNTKPPIMLFQLLAA